MSCPVCAEFGSVCCPVCEPRRRYEVKDCDVCDGLGFFPFKNGKGLSVKEYYSLSLFEQTTIDKEHCEECNGTGEITREIEIY